MKLYLAETLSNFNKIDVLSEILKTNNGQTILDSLQLVNNINQCDAVLVPHDAYDFSRSVNYLRYLDSLADKKLILYSDRSDFPIKPKLKNSIALRVSLHPAERDVNLIVTPYNIDFSREIKLRKLDKYPVVNFVGYMPSLLSPKRFLKSLIQSPLHPIQGNGAFVRKLAIEKCIKELPHFNYKLRDKYFTSEINRLTRSENRSEYISLMRSSDIILAPRGDSNQSLRFYEALSEGKSLLIPDSTMTFPYNLIKSTIFKKHCLFFKIFRSNLDSLVKDYWQSFDSQKLYENSQRQIRSFFIKELEFTAFMSKILNMNIYTFKQIANFRQV